MRSEESSRDSMEDFTAEEMLVMNPGHGMDMQDQFNSLNISAEEAEEIEQPRSLIATNVDLSVFLDDIIKSEFEANFLTFDPNIVFYYIRTFRRVRIDFSCHITAAAAKSSMDSLVVGGNTIHCYFFKAFRARGDQEDAFLAPPPLEKQFLISPPCSPPVGWEQPREDHPVVDYDLLAAMASMAPGEDHELHPSQSVTIRGASVDLPAIVVNVCHGEGLGALGGGGRKILQTRCPQRQSSVEIED